MRGKVDQRLLESQNCDCGPPQKGETCTEKWIRCNARLRWFQDNIWKVKEDTHADSSRREEAAR